MATLSERLRRVVAMTTLDELTSRGSETELVDEAADALDAMEAAANDILSHNNETSREKLRAALAMVRK